MPGEEGRRARHRPEPAVQRRARAKPSKACGAPGGLVRPRCRSPQHRAGLPCRAREERPRTSSASSAPVADPPPGARDTLKTLARQLAQRQRLAEAAPATRPSASHRPGAGSPSPSRRSWPPPTPAPAPTCSLASSATPARRANWRPPASPSGGSRPRGGRGPNPAVRRPAPASSPRPARSERGRTAPPSSPSSSPAATTRSPAASCAPMDGVVNSPADHHRGRRGEGRRNHHGSSLPRDRLLINARVKPSDIAFRSPARRPASASAPTTRRSSAPCPARCCASAPTPSPTGAGRLLRGAQVRQNSATPPSTFAFRWHGRRRQHPDRQACDDGVHAPSHRQDPRQIPPRTLMRFPPPRGSPPAARPRFRRRRARRAPAGRRRQGAAAATQRALGQAPLRRRRPGHPGLPDFLPSVGLSYRNADSRDESQGSGRSTATSAAATPACAGILFNGGAGTAPRAGRRPLPGRRRGRPRQRARAGQLQSPGLLRHRAPAPDRRQPGATLERRSGSRPAWPAGWTPAASRRPNST